LATKTSHDELGSILEAFQPALNSIDLRTIAVRPQGEAWQNLITTMNISEKTVGQVSVEQEKLPYIRNEEFAVFFLAIPFEYSIFESIKRGNLVFRHLGIMNLEVKTRSLDLPAFKVQNDQFGYFGSLQEWTILVTASSQPQERNKLWSVIDSQKQELRLQSYRDVTELFRDVLKITYMNRDDKDFIIIIPPLAQIVTAKFRGESFEVRIANPSNLSGLQLNLALRKSGTHPAEILWKDRIKIKKNEYVVYPKNMVPFDILEADLIHPILALTLDSKAVIVPLQNPVEPLLKTLDSFCPLADFKKMLLEPQMFGKEPQKIFETAVCWLLSMAGLNPIYLSTNIKDLKGKDRKFDSLKIESGFDLGCADIIAYKDNDCVLLVDCDIGSINETKLQRLSATSKHFESSLNTYGKLRFIPVLFTTKECEVQSKAGVRIVGKNVIEIIFEQIFKGNRDEAASQIVSSYFIY
jgi:hypothetical protein